MDLITALAALALLAWLVVLILEIMKRTRPVVVEVGLVIVSVRKFRVRSSLRPFWRSFAKRDVPMRCLGSSSGKGPESYPGFLSGGCRAPYG